MTMTKAKQAFHRFMLSLGALLLVWSIINKFVIQISIKDFIVMQIVMVIIELLSIFVKRLTGLIKPTNKH